MTGRFNRAVLILAACNLFTLQAVFPQDTIKFVPPKISLKEPGFILSEHRYKYVSLHKPDTLTRVRSFWYPSKANDDIFSFLPGYYLSYMDVGQVNNLRYNQLDPNNTAVFRHERPVNDLIDGSADLNLFSRNEIAEIENTGGYGNYLNNYVNTVNIIQNQIFRNRPYTELSFHQDRFDNLYLDASYHQNIFRSLNFNFGILKHSYAGKYKNSDFDKWQGRFNFNFRASNKLNLFLYSNYVKIQRGLNEGVNPDTIPDLKEETLFDVSRAIVVNSDAYEIRERFDIDMGLVFTADEDGNYFTRVQFFTGNSFRKYRDEENRPSPNGIFLKENSNWIDYGAIVHQTLRFKLARRVSFLLKTEAEFDHDIVHTELNDLTGSGRIYFLQEAGIFSKNFSLDAYGKAYKLDYLQDGFLFDYGAKGGLAYRLDSATAFKLHVIFSRTTITPSYGQFFISGYSKDNTTAMFSAGAGVESRFGNLLVEFYSSNSKVQEQYGSGLSEIEKSGLNVNLLLKLWKFELEANYSRILKNRGYANLMNPSDINPVNSLNAMFSVHDAAFRNKLEYKVGFNSRYWSDYYALFYDGRNNSFRPYYDSNHSFLIKENATLDFFIMSKINKAVFSLTLENILNRALYTTGLYPYQNRGGLFNVISRFNITWYFLD